MNGLRISEALDVDIDDLDVDRDHRTLRVTRKGGKHATIHWRPAPREPSISTSANEPTGRCSSAPPGLGWTATPPIGR
jgi:hypothetical protein